MRLIDADRLLCVIDDDGGWAYDGLEYQAYMSCLRGVLEDIEEAPTIDPESLRPTANWIAELVSEVWGEEATYGSRGNGICGYYCSNCHNEAILDEAGKYFTPKSCPECGAKMLNYKEFEGDELPPELRSKEGENNDRF